MRTPGLCSRREPLSWVLGKAAPPLCSVVYRAKGGGDALTHHPHVCSNSHALSDLRAARAQTLIHARRVCRARAPAGNCAASLVSGSGFPGGVLGQSGLDVFSNWERYRAVPTPGCAELPQKFLNSTSIIIHPPPQPLERQPGRPAHTERETRRGNKAGATGKGMDCSPDHRPCWAFLNQLHVQ